MFKNAGWSFIKTGPLSIWRSTTPLGSITDGVYRQLCCLGTILIVLTDFNSGAR